MRNVDYTCAHTKGKPPTVKANAVLAAININDSVTAQYRIVRRPCHRSITDVWRQNLKASQTCQPCN